MLFLIIGVLGILMKVGDIAPVANWSWYVVLTPFALAVAWWTWADWSGYTKRKAAEKIEAKKAERLAKQRENIGLSNKRR